MKQYQIDATSRNIVENEIKAMTDVEKQKFYDDFSEDPAKALMPYISTVSYTHLTLPTTPYV